MNTYERISGADEELLAWVKDLFLRLRPIRKHSHNNDFY